MKIKYKYIIIISVFAVLFYLFGAMFKVLHWAFPYGGGNYFGGEELIIISMLFWIISGILLIVKAIKTKGNDFLNR